MADYVSWEELLDEPAGPATPQAPGPSVGPAPAVPTPPRAPEEFSRLMAEREQLEQRLKSLTGQGAPNPEDERLQRCFPVRAHTKESRIEERQLQKHDEHTRMLARQSLENHALRRRREVEQQQARKEAEERLRHQRHLQQQATEQQERERAQARQLAREEALEYEQWLLLRQRALQSATLERHQLHRWHEERAEALAATRAQESARLLQQRQSEAQQLQQARDERSRTSQQHLMERRREEQAVQLRLDARRRRQKEP